MNNDNRKQFTTKDIFDISIERSMQIGDDIYAIMSETKDVLEMHARILSYGKSLANDEEKMAAMFMAGKMQGLIDAIMNPVEAIIMTDMIVKKHAKNLNK